MALLICTLLLSIYSFFLYTFTKDFWKMLKEIPSQILRVSYFLMLLLPGGILAYILKREQYVYFWDYSNYWGKSIQFTKDFFLDPIKTLEQVNLSIQLDEYNSLVNLFLAPIQKLLSPLEYDSYVVSIYLMFGLPFILILSSFIFKNNSNLTQYQKLIIPLGIAFFTPLLIPIRYGFVDVIGLVWLGMILHLLVQNNYFTRLNVKSSIGLGLLLLLLVLSRRFYAFWIVAFFVASGLIAVFTYFKEKDKIALRNAIINLTIGGLVFTGILLIFFYPFFEMTVLKDYTDIYSAYRGRSFGQEWDHFINYFGLLLLLIAVVGVWTCLKRDKKLVLFLSLFTIITVILFTRINDFGYQHFYLITPFFLIFFIEALQTSTSKKILTYAILGVLILNNVFVFGLNEHFNKTYAFSYISGKPFYRSDYNELIGIYNHVLELQKSNKTVYCLSSGLHLNDSTIRTASFPDKPYPNNLFITQHVDKRDHFPNELLAADYILTTNPIDLHLGVDNQQIVYYFQQQIVNGILKQNYKLVKSFPLEQGIMAELYERVAFCTAEQTQQMVAHFKTLYPEYPQMYNINTLQTSVSKIIPGDNFGGATFIEGMQGIMIHPGSSVPTQVHFNFDQNYTQISFLATFNDKESIKNNCNPARDGEVYLRIYDGDTLLQEYYITHFEDQEITLDITQHKNLIFSVDKGKNEDYCDWFKITNIQVK